MAIFLRILIKAGFSKALMNPRVVQGQMNTTVRTKMLNSSRHRINYITE
jgi:hypothetical protein